MENVVHKGHRQRLRQQFQNGGLDSFSDVQTLEYLLTFSIARGDVNPLAHALLQRFGSLANVLDASAEDLQQVPGVGEHTAALLTLMPQLFRRYSICKSEKKPILSSTEKIASYLMPFFHGAVEEQFYLVCMDAKCKVLDCRMLFSGGLNAVSVNIRKVVETALRHHASSVILAHNHPWGVALPSREDEAVTREIESALELVGVRLADHMIVSDEDCVSLRESGFFRDHF